MSPNEAVHLTRGNKLSGETGKWHPVKTQTIAFGKMQAQTTIVTYHRRVQNSSHASECMQDCQVHNVSFICVFCEHISPVIDQAMTGVERAFSYSQK